MPSRRTVLKGAAALPISAVLADPMLSRAMAAAHDAVSITTSDGRTVNATLAVPSTVPAPAMILIHEWWGLNAQIKAIAGEFAKQGYVAIAVDLYDGEVATDPTNARRLMGGVDPEQATATLGGWIDWALSQKFVNGRIGTVGWCFGGGWSLNASIARPVDATIVYYGNVARKAPDLGKLKGPVLGHYAESDQWINHAMVDGFEAEMKQAGKPFTSHWYDAHHGFANPTTARYDKEDAALSWSRTLEFLKANLG